MPFSSCFKTFWTVSRLLKLLFLAVSSGMLQLRGRDDDARGRTEGAHDAMRHEVHHKAETEHAEPGNATLPARKGVQSSQNQ